MITIYSHYLYLIINKETKEIYVGIRSCLGNPEEDINYFGSGVKIKKEVERLGKVSFKKVILAVCPTREMVAALEALVVNEDFLKKQYTLNLAIGGSIGNHGITRDAANLNRFVKFTGLHPDLALSGYEARKIMKCNTISQIVEDYGYQLFQVFPNCKYSHFNQIFETIADKLILNTLTYDLGTRTKTDFDNAIKLLYIDIAKALSHDKLFPSIAKVFSFSESKIKRIFESNQTNFFNIFDSQLELIKNTVQMNSMTGEPNIDPSAKFYPYDFYSLQEKHIYLN